MHYSAEWKENRSILEMSFRLLDIKKNPKGKKLIYSPASKIIFINETIGT